MNKKEFLIVGDGFAALFFAFELIKRNRSFVLYSEGRKGASQVSAGIVNPVVLKKFTLFDKAKEQVASLVSTMKEMETLLGATYYRTHLIHRIFHDEKERELWLKKASELPLSEFLSSEIVFLEGVENPFGCGVVKNSGRVEITTWFTDFRAFLERENLLTEERFIYSELDPLGRTYRGMPFDHVVFSEGVGVKDNPYFKKLAIKPNKGHHLRVGFEKPISLEVTLKKKHFLFPLSEDTHYYGGTYDRENLLSKVDDSAKEQLLLGLGEFYKEDFEVKGVEFGFRPTVKDRRPLLGTHKEFSGLHVFNGLGARGLLNANYYAPMLLNFILNGSDLPSEVVWDRFEE